MKSLTLFRIHYRWPVPNGFMTASMVMRHYNGYAALSAASVMLMADAKPFAVEVA